jgi:hypothetical protein
MLFKLMPALLKGLLGPVVPNAILDGHLPIILGVGFGLDFCPRFWRSFVRGFACIWTFRRFGPIVIGLARPIFDPLLDRTFVRVFGRLEIRLCFLPYLNCSDVCLPIANKTAHPVRVRFLGK